MNSGPVCVMKRQRAIMLLLLLATSIVIVPTARVWAIDPVKLDFLWLSEPKLEYEWLPGPLVANVDVSPEDFNAKLARERLQAAQSVLRVPTSPSFDPAAILQAVMTRLEAGEPHRLVRVEMIAAACELDDGRHVDKLWKWAQGDSDAEAIVQQACIRWRSALPVERWRKSLIDPATSDQKLLQAVDGLGAAGAAEDVKLLQGVVMDGTRPATLRLGSARAIGRLATNDQMDLAKQLRASTAANAELLAVEVLANSPAQGATEFVQDIALHGPLLAQRAAYRWLCQRDASTAQRLVGSFLKHVDSEVRLLALAQITLADTDQTLPALFAAFDDEHPGVRVAAREHVLTCCTRSDERLRAAIDLLKPAIGSEDWRGLEQSIRLAVELKQPSHCDRLLSLVEHARPEVSITACWALRHLAEDAEILNRMLARVQAVTDKLLDVSNINVVMTEVDLQCTAHLLEAFGHRKFEPAKATCLRYVPKNGRLGQITRMTAIWSCGKLWEHGENKELIRELHARIADKASESPETTSLRYTATIALGWIADSESRQPLITCDEFKPTAIGYATEWALQRIDARK